MKRAPINPQTLGEHLRAARIDRGKTQREVADLLGVAYQTIVKWEHNLILVGPKYRARVIAFLGYDPSLIIANPTGDSTAS
ncbi:MAG: helix-turn-helix domain-containing protein [Chthoniobacter sp.]|nr:helix-turn-helix domain-containing protein [Chthoniobacter sp.]